MSGLAAGIRLHQAGYEVQILEASDDVGGRVRTDRVDGFLLDRGFQVFLDAYPTARDILRLDRLGLQAFRPGALIQDGSRRHLLSDPLRDPAGALATILSPAASLADKLRVARLKHQLARQDSSAIFRNIETDTRSYLLAEGFSPAFIDRFFRPFYGGIFLERALATSSRMFAFVFKMFALGRATLPRAGIQALARDLADRLPPEAVVCHAKATRITATSVTTADGTVHQADAVLQTVDLDPPPPGGPTSLCAWFAADVAPFSERMILLNGGHGPVNHIVVPSNLQPSYAPAGQHLIGVNAVEPDASDPALSADVLHASAARLLGVNARSWRLLRVDRIARSLPMQTRVLDPHLVQVRCADGVYQAGDRLANGSVEAALVTGLRAAQAIMEDH